MTLSQNGFQKILIGRAQEFNILKTCLKLGRHVLLEGPVGVGKTHLAMVAAESLGKHSIRIDGDARFTEQKLIGSFDPSLILKHGYKKEEFIKGPLVRAMEEGCVLFINELNRLNESVQNVLLPALDEGRVEVPNYGTVQATPGFCVLATQNPSEFVATSHLSEALTDRCEWISMDYPSESDEIEILQLNNKNIKKSKETERMLHTSVAFARMTRSHEAFRRGASIRTAQALYEVGAVLWSQNPKSPFEDAFLQAVRVTVPHRVELKREQLGDESPLRFLENLAQDFLKSESESKKNGTHSEKKNF